MSKKLITIGKTHKLLTTQTDPDKPVYLCELAKDYTQDAVITLYEIMNDKGNSPNVRAVCAKDLLDRGWGRPFQMNINIENPQDIKDMDTFQLASNVDVLSKQLNAIIDNYNKNAQTVQNQKVNYK